MMHPVAGPQVSRPRRQPPTEPPVPAAGEYAAAQAALVAALTGTGSPPTGFDPVRLEIARKALLRKRCGEIAVHWPVTRAVMGERFEAEFAVWARHRPTAGSWRDGWDFLSDLASRSLLPPGAARELAQRELIWRRDATGELRRRRVPGLARAGGRLLARFAGLGRTPGR